MKIISLPFESRVHEGIFKIFVIKDSILLTIPSNYVYS